MFRTLTRYSQKLAGLLLALTFAVSVGSAQERVAGLLPADKSRDARQVEGQDKMKEKAEIKRLLAELTARLVELKRRAEGITSLKQGSSELWAKELAWAELRLTELRRRVVDGTEKGQGNRKIMVAGGKEIEAQLTEATRQVAEIKLIWSKRKAKETVETIKKPAQDEQVRVKQ
jgi:hypothetical protein